MKKIIVFWAVSILCLVNIAFAQKITVSHNFFGGWKYAVDGGKYEWVGIRGKSLCKVMAGNEVALNEMKKYSSVRTMSLITSISGLCLTGYVSVKLINGTFEEHDNNYLLVGIPLSVISIISQIVSDNYLRKAVRIYNNEKKAIHLDLNLNRKFAITSELISLNLTYAF